MTQYQRTIDELLVRYKLEPSLKEVFVEGYSDVQFFQRLLQLCELADARAYCIETVEIPDEDTADLVGLSGNRLRVFALSEKLLGVDAKILCIVDRDLDDLLETNHSSQLLKYTDLSCPPIYTLSPSVLSEVCRTLIHKEDLYSELLWESMCEILQRLAFYRATKIIWSWNIKSPSAKKYIEIHQGKFEFNEVNYREAFLRHVTSQNKYKELDETIASLQEKAPIDCRRYVNGHDYIEMILILIRTETNLGRFDERILSRALMLLNDFQEAIEGSLAGELRATFATN